MVKQRQTDTHVYFVGGTFSQWAKSTFQAPLYPGGPILTFNCAEQYMMARKAHLFGDTATLDRIMAIQQTGYNFGEVPKAQKIAGREVKPFDEALWDAESMPAVFAGSYFKYTQNPPMHDELLATGDRIIVEGAHYDRIWGVGLDYADPRIEDEANWDGQNRLGRTLTELRGVFRLIQSSPHTPRRSYDPFTKTFI
ncbi:MAG: NADAR family protein [Verrucomicrobiaceae bacterium]|nr:MAG: NADAR family protein [Verrucomicrobiaceae bacterium]